MFTFGDAHIYNNLIEQVGQQLLRNPLEKPILKLNKNVNDIFNFKIEDIEFCNYNPHPAIKGEVSI